MFLTMYFDIFMLLSLFVGCQKFLEITTLGDVDAGFSKSTLYDGLPCVLVPLGQSEEEVTMDPVKGPMVMLLLVCSFCTALGH